MEFSIKFKKIGDKEWRDQKVLLPDHCEPYLQKYTLRIVEYHMFNSMGLYFQSKTEPDMDIVSYTIKNPKIQENITDGFKHAFEELMAIDAFLSMPDTIAVPEPILEPILEAEAPPVFKTSGYPE